MTGRTERVSSEIPFTMIVIIAFVCGVDLRDRNETSRRRGISERIHNERNELILIIRSVAVFNMMLCAISRILLSVRSTSELASATDIFRIIHSAIHMIVMGWSARQLWRNQEELRNLLIGNDDCFRYNGILFAWFSCWLCYSLTNIYSVAIRSMVNRDFFETFYLVGQYSGLQVLNFQYIVIIIYIQGQIALRRKLERLDRDLLNRSPLFIVEEKKRIRSTIQTLNGTFGTLIALLYLKIFLLVYIHFVLEMVRSSIRKGFLREVHMTIAFLNIGFLFYMACTGSDIVRISRSTARRTTTSRFCVMTFEQQEQLRRHLAFDEDRDSLTIFDCLEHSKSSFISYLGALVTSLGVLFQFDYPLMAKFDVYKNTVVKKQRL